MGPGELLRQVAATLSQLGIPHFVTGSTGTITYGEPRFTNGIDIAVQLDPTQAKALCQAFSSPDFYIELESALRAVRDCSSFNLIHLASGLKVDFRVTDRSPYNRKRYERAKTLKLLDGFNVRFATPEDAILKKLEYFQAGGSEKHMRDIAGVLRVSTAQLDREYIARWAKVLNVLEEWKKAQEWASERN